MNEILIEDYDYLLPPERIAQYPLEERDSSKLLVYRNSSITDAVFSDIGEYLPAHSLLVFNNTRVIKARLLFGKKSGARIEIFCLEPTDPADYERSLGSENPVEWKCLIGNLKKWKTGQVSLEFDYKGSSQTVSAEKTGKDGDVWRIRFAWTGNNISFGEVIEAAGHVPLPPYISRSDEGTDLSRYQTVYSLIRGSVAAPTAGLHFTRKVFDRLDSLGIAKTEITLHVGAGTFQPVKTESILGHRMHTEHFFISRDSLEKILCKAGSIIAVGTTSVRTLESLYWLGEKAASGAIRNQADMYLGQWESYNLKGEISQQGAIGSLIDLMDENRLDILQVPTRIIIVPGYRFRLTDGLVTNFHLPKSTLLLLISAWTGQSWKRLYEHAISNGYRFLSYGDSSLLLR